jgi:hypothetical protein
LSALSLLSELRILKNEGYSDMAGLKIHPEFKLEFKFIDSMDIDKETRKQRYIKELSEDLAQNQAALDKVMES